MEFHVVIHDSSINGISPAAVGVCSHYWEPSVGVCSHYWEPSVGVCSHYWEPSVGVCSHYWEPSVGGSGQGGINVDDVSAV